MGDYFRISPHLKNGKRARRTLMPWRLREVSVDNLDDLPGGISLG
jgi:hypothetical protein